MKKLFYLLIGTFLFSSLSIASGNESLAGITVYNKTKLYATGYLNNKGCTAQAGDSGIIKPGEHRTIPEFYISMYCGKSCSGDLFMSKNCSGRSIATIKVEKNKGVVGITNHNVDGYSLSGSGFNVTISSGTRNWFETLFNL